MRSTCNNIVQGQESDCQCRSLAIDIEGMKLDLVIMQNKQKTYIESQILLADKSCQEDQIFQLKQNLLNEVKQREKLENDIAILVTGRNTEIEKLNNTIASLQNKLEIIHKDKKKYFIKNRRKIRRNYSHQLNESNFRNNENCPAVRSNNTS